MKTFTIDTDNNITVHPSRKAARETGAGVFATEEQFADLIGPDNKRLVEIWNGLAGVKPVTKFANRKSATERIWKALQSLGEQAAAPLPETPFDATEAEAAPGELPVAEPEHADAETARPREDATLQAEIEPVALTPPDAGEAAETVANVGAQEPHGAPAERDRDRERPAPEESAQGQESREAGEIGGERRAARGQQDGAGGRDAPTQERRHAGGDHGADGLAEAHRPRVHGWRDEESRVYRRVLQIREGRAQLSDQPVAPPRSLLPARLRPRRAFLLLVPRSRCPRHAVTAALADAQPARAGANVGQTWRNGGQSWLACSSRNSADQSPSARHSPDISGCPVRSRVSMAAISRRQRSGSYAPLGFGFGTVLWVISCGMSVSICYRHRFGGRVYELKFLNQLGQVAEFTSRYGFEHPILGSCPL